MSDSSQPRPRHLIVGTAGHIDHGKTTLVRALTGVDTDRLAEEKRRGISIDIGFAHMDLEGGASVSFVDVPGHENYIKNMLAGISGIEAVMLVVAADEGVKPQTREHFDICRLLHVTTGLVALTKVDLASAEQIEAAVAEVNALCRGSFLEGRSIVSVSAATGQGLDDLRRRLGELVTALPPRDDSGFARLPVDRSFAMKGFGTVVTGTLTAGKLAVGESVILHPERLECRVRGLQVHGGKATIAYAGQRTALNLSGVDHSHITRGMVLTHSNPLATTTVFDAAVSWLRGMSSPERRQQFLVHTGTAEIPALLKMFPGAQFARIWLSRAALVLPDDHFVLRRPSPAATVGGGIIVDAFPPARQNRKRRAECLKRLANSSWPERLEQFVGETSQRGDMNDLVRRTGLKPAALRALIGETSRLKWLDSASRVVTTSWLDETRRSLVKWLATFHRSHPSLKGAPLSQAPAPAKSVLAYFPEIRVDGDVIALATHRPQISSEQNLALARIEDAFRRAGYQPPPPTEVLHSVGSDAVKGRPLLESLIKSKRLVRIAEDVVLHADVVEHIRSSLAAHKGRRFSVPEFKSWTQVSRKYAIPLLEYLDRQHITRREGDIRVVL